MCRCNINMKVKVLWVPEVSVMSFRGAAVDMISQKPISYENKSHLVSMWIRARETALAPCVEYRLK